LPTEQVCDTSHRLRLSTKPAHRRAGEDGGLETDMPRADSDVFAKPRAPRTVGRYAIYGEIAAGGMATVHFGRLLGAVGFTRPVAIKQLHPQFAKDPEFRARFIEEARLVSRIRHQNVVPTLDVVAAEDELFLVLEYVQGESLWRLMKAAHDRRVRVPPHIAITIVSHVLHGLHAAHEAKDESGAPIEIVHRDVSPQNVLVGTDGAARVLDFGVARPSTQAEASPDEKIQGKLSYMAPEQLAGAPVGRQADLYATAVILWELLAGRRLFHRANPQTLLIDKLFRSNVPRPSAMNEHVPRGVDAVVLKALAREPEDRYATAREMSVALESCGKLATGSEVGEWVERMAHDALEKRARQIADSEARAVPTAVEAKDITTPSMSPLVASINPLTIATPSSFPVKPAPLPDLSAFELGPPHKKRASLASLLEPDLEARVLERLRHLSFERKRFVAASVLAVAGFVVVAGAARAIASRFGAERPVAARAVPQAKDVLVEPVGACPRGMAVIPGGHFFMGSDDDLPAERPAHHVTLSPYCIDIFEVTADEYRACADRGDCRRASTTNEWGGIASSDHKTFDALCNIRDPAGRGRHPINCVDWEMASQYCGARGARLPTEAEWEFSARSSDGRKYPWGDDAPSPRLLNACGKECLEWGKRNHVDEAAMYIGGDGWATTAPVGSFPDGRSKFGVQDLVGNVWEWVADYFGPYDGERAEDPHGPAAGRERVIRGGAWNGAYADWMRPTFRYHDPPDTKSFGIGFRCASGQGSYAQDVLAH
jgi:formylglycine-generating enzyme required for sulfatase activity/serine/threonine protein kinase